MSYWDKVRKKEENRKKAEEIIKSPRFQEYMRQREQEAVLNALARFSFIACDFLETQHYYKGKGLKKFLAFVLKRMKYTEENELYFKEYHEYALEEYGLDILGELGLAIEKEEKTDDNDGE